MKEFILKNKVVLAIIAIVLIGAILVGVMLLNGDKGNNDNTKPTGGSQGTTQDTEGTSAPTKPTDATKPSDGTEPSDGTNPTEGTNPSEGTEPTDGTEPSQGTEPTDPSQGTEPPVTNPPVTEPKPTEPKPTDPPVTEPKPTEPKPTEPKPTTPPETEPPVVTQPSTYPTEPKDEGYKGVTPDNLSEETVAGWNETDYSMFKVQYWTEMTPEEKHNYQILEENNGVYYSCGTNGHYCVTPAEHEQRTTFICTYCGNVDCAGWGVRADILRNAYNYRNCPEYNVFKDPMEYCQTCGKRCFIIGVTSILEGCQQKIMGSDCFYCGEYYPPYVCHTCKEENLKPEFKQYIIP